MAAVIVEAVKTVFPITLEIAKFLVRKSAERGGLTEIENKALAVFDALMEFLKSAEKES